MRLPRPRRIVVLVLAALVAMLSSGIGLTAAYAYAGDVPRGTTVLGVDIGGMSRTEAEAALSAQLAEHQAELSAPVKVQVADVPAEIDPAEVGLRVDVPATVAKASQRGNPLTGLFGTRHVAPVVAVDTERLYDELLPVAEGLGEAMTLPEIRFEGTRPVPVYPKPGLGLEPEATAAAVTSAWPQLSLPGQWRGPEVIPVPLVEIHPVTSAEDVDRLLAEFARPAVAAPVTVTLPEGRTATLTPAEIARSLDLTADPRGEIVPKVDPAALREVLGDQLAEVETAPVDATVVLTGDRPTVRPGKDGVAVDTELLARELVPVLSQPAPRTVAAQTTVVPPAFTTQDAEALGITEQVSSFTTYFEGGLSVPRNHNIAKVAEMVDGAIVKPGEVFSLNGYTGERGYDQGFVDAPVILDGRLQPAVGGGISQFTTTLFNASYYAGLEDVEHQPHSYYYSRYPSVIESTIFYPTLDLKFRNNTPYGILIDTSYTENSVTVTLWSTKVWDEVTTEWGPRRDVTKPERRYVEPGPTCIATQGIDGFTQDAWRIFRQDGIEVKREKFSWRYDAQPEVICGKDPAEQGDDD